MPTLSDYLQAEGRGYLERIRRLLAATQPDAEALHRAGRGLRGTAQLAREDRVYRAGLALESAARSVAAGGAGWSAALLHAARVGTDDLQVLLERSEPEPALDQRLERSLQRWQDAGVVAGERAPTGSGTGVGRQEFRDWAAREAEAVAEALDGAVRSLSENPMEREALKQILRRQRALLGAARLDEIPVVAEILHAIEDLTRVIAKLDVGVKQEWLDVYRVAREGLTRAVASLRQDVDPPPSHALARLRHMRAELMERYGAGEAVSHAAGEHEGLAPARRLSETDSAARLSSDDSAVPITSLEYHGAAALRRALELRHALERTVEQDPDAREQLDELFDLIRLALA